MRVNSRGTVARTTREADVETTVIPSVNMVAKRMTVVESLETESRFENLKFVYVTPTSNLYVSVDSDDYR